MAVDVKGGPHDAGRSTQGAMTPVRCDVSDENAVAALMASVQSAFGRLDVLCNSAGITGGGGPLIDLDVAVFDRVMAVNVRGTLLTMKHGIPLILASGGGSIINIASIASFVARPGSPAYTASKGAVMALTRSAAVEYAAQGIRVNAICPGTIETPLNATMPPERKEAYRVLHPVGRLGHPEEVAEMALFLASDRCTFATGAAFVVDGGRTAT